MRLISPPLHKRAPVAAFVESKAPRSFALLKEQKTFWRELGHCKVLSLAMRRLLGQVADKSFSCVALEATHETLGPSNVLADLTDHRVTLKPVDRKFLTGPKSFVALWTQKANP